MPTCFVFDESENKLSLEDIKPENDLITVLEIQGIKFTSKSFQFEIIIRQALIMANKPVFQSCLIRKNISIPSTVSLTTESHREQSTIELTGHENENENETGAVVKIYGDDGSVYDFAESNGTYKSTITFQAIPDVNYRLDIETSNGNNYVSNLETLTTATPLDSITATPVISNGVSGVEIAAFSFDPLNTSKYYRYTYEETYKVIVPRWSPNKLTFEDDNSIEISLRDDPETRTCYSTNISNDIIITSTNELLEDRITNFPIRFIPQDDYSIANRYSILVTQYVESFDSYNFYRILNFLFHKYFD